MIRLLRWLFPQFRALELALQQERDDAHAKAERIADLNQQVFVAQGETAEAAAKMDEQKSRAEREAYQARQWRERCEAAEKRVQELTEKLLDDRARVADSMSLRVMGKRIFSKADVSEMPQPPRPIAPGRVMGRQAVASDTRSFFESLIAKPDAPPAS